MVFWYLIKETEEHIIYEYYPENKKDKKPGIITIDKVAEKIKLTQPAEEDFEAYYEEFNAKWYWYYHHAEARIIKDYNNGENREKGMSVWY